MKNKNVGFFYLGSIDYEKCWKLQEQVFSKIVSIKTGNRNLSDSTENLHGQIPELTPNYLFFCEHPHVYTLGKSGKERNLLVERASLNEIRASYVKINRGGDITYHGPGQIVGYPILDLDNFFTDIGRYLRCLEEAIIRTLKEYDVNAGRINGLTGVWIDPDDPVKTRKIASIGVRCSRWVTMHGFAFNINTDLSYFDHIIPCGIRDVSMTSLEKEFGKAVDIEAVKEKLKKRLIQIFGMDLTPIQLQTLSNKYCYESETY